jgi:hypothetical protein
MRISKFINFQSKGKDVDSKHLWNVGQYLPDYTAQYPRRQPSSIVFLSSCNYSAIFFIPTAYVMCSLHMCSFCILSLQITLNSGQRNLICAVPIRLSLLLTVTPHHWVPGPAEWLGVLPPFLPRLLGAGCEIVIAVLSCFRTTSLWQRKTVTLAGKPSSSSLHI